MIRYNIIDRTDSGREMIGSEQVCLGGFNGNDRRYTIEVTSTTFASQTAHSQLGNWNSILRMCGFEGLPYGKDNNKTIIIPRDGAWSWRQLPYQLYRQLCERGTRAGDDSVERWRKTIQYNRGVCRMELLHLMLLEWRLGFGHGFSGITNGDYFAKYDPVILETVKDVWNHDKPKNKVILGRILTHNHEYSDELFPNRSRTAATTRIGIRGRATPHMHLVAERDKLLGNGFSLEAMDLIAVWYKRYDVKECRPYD